MLKFNKDNVNPGDVVETSDGRTHTVANTGKFFFNVEETNPETGKNNHYHYIAIKDKK